MKRETDPASGVKERGRARRVDEEGEGGGEEWQRCSGRGGAPSLSHRGRGAALKGESEGGGAVSCVSERVFGGAAAALGFGFSYGCIYFFLTTKQIQPIYQPTLIPAGAGTSWAPPYYD